jgi:hypothetical protein
MNLIQAEAAQKAAQEHSPRSAGYGTVQQPVSRTYPEWVEIVQALHTAGRDDLARRLDSDITVNAQRHGDLVPDIPSR